MTKNIYTLITAIIGGLETIACGIVTYCGATSIMDASTATATVSAIGIGGTAIIAICGKFVKTTA